MVVPQSQEDHLADEKLKVSKRTADSTTEKPASKAAKSGEKHEETTSEFFASLASVLVVGLFIITFCLQAFEIPSSSMENTLLIGDHVFVDRVLLAPKTNWFPVIPYRQVQHGDIVVFLSPAEAGLYVVKRIIGIPGDRIHLRDGVVYRNGQPLQEPYVIHNGSVDAYRDNFPAISTDRRRRRHARVAAHHPAAPARRRPGGSRRLVLRHGRQSRRELRQPVLGIYSPGKRDRPSHVHLLVFPDSGESYKKDSIAERLDSWCISCSISSTRPAGPAC